MTDDEQDRCAHQALAAAQDFYAALFGTRYGSVAYASTRDPWCEWFRGLFNTTWAVYDQRDRVLWLLATTDMD